PRHRGRTARVGRPGPGRDFWRGWCRYRRGPPRGVECLLRPVGPVFFRSGGAGRAQRADNRLDVRFVLDRFGVEWLVVRWRLWRRDVQRGGEHRRVLIGRCLLVGWFVIVGWLVVERLHGG